MRWTDEPWPHVWIGTSVESRAYLPRLDILAEVNATTLFASFEPLLEDLGDLSGYLQSEAGPCTCGVPAEMAIAGHEADCGTHERFRPLHWAIVGAESGHRARTFELAWARSIISQCRAAGVACFVKQLGPCPVAELGTDDVVGRRILIDGGMPLHHRKGADTSEWPEDLRVQEFPS